MASPDSSDEVLLSRVAEGDETACRVLVDRHLGPVVAFSGRVLGDTAEAEDVAQDTFVALWRHAGRWQPGRAKLATWLHRVAMNRCIDRLRRRPSIPLDQAQEPVDQGPGPEDGLLRADVSRLVRAALSALPERQRIAVTLCHFQDLGNIEAAAVMEISVEALESLLSRGRRRLRETLAERRPELLGEI